MQAAHPRTYDKLSTQKMYNAVGKGRFRGMIILSAIDTILINHGGTLLHTAETVEIQRHRDNI